MPEVSEELFAALVGGNAEVIARVIESNPVSLPRGKDPETKEVDAWFERINRDNQELAEAYGFKVNALGMSESPHLVEQVERVRQYYLTHPEDRFVQKSYTEMISGGTMKPMLDRPEPMVVRSRVAKEVVTAIENLPEEKLNRLLSLLKEV